MELNDTQSGLISMIFQYCADQNLPLLDFVDLKNVLNFLSENNEAVKDYGFFSKATAGAILRKIMVLEQQGADIFFGEPAFDVNDLLQN